jgi:hypothetical protein
MAWGATAYRDVHQRSGSAWRVAPDLATAIRRNPELEVLLVNGIYDLATPYFPAVRTMGHMGLPRRFLQTDIDGRSQHFRT